MESKTLGNYAIRVQNLSKCYQIYDNPRDRLKQFILPRLRSVAGKASRQYFREFWALNDVSFEVKKGEAVGIIGRNGSGKSTLLQMICGTLSPTNGYIQTNGRVAALLELGSGFNPEFTGRENVYMNASVLGLSKGEIDACYDKIAAFADIGQFIDQPVKTYSSGMYVRLAFAVIAHVNADILIVDEALAVGDAAFSQKCMRFIRNFKENGSLIFVSHDTAAVQNLCKSAIWLAHGQIQQVGTSKKVTEAYLQATLQEAYGDTVNLVKSSTSNASDTNSEDSALIPVIDYGSKLAFTDNVNNASGWKTGDAEILSLSLEKLSSGLSGIFEGGEKVRVHIEAKTHKALERPILGFTFKDRLGQVLFGENTLSFTAVNPRPVNSNQRLNGDFVFILPMLPDGDYSIMASFADGEQLDNIQHHYMHDACLVKVSSSKIRFGLVGIAFEQVSLEVCDA